LISLNFEKTLYIHFKTKNSPSIDMKFDHKNRLIPNAVFSKFLGSTIDSTLSWRMHVDHLTNKLSTACYVIRYVKPLMSHFLSLFHTVMSYGIILWENSCYSTQIFWIQKRVIRIIMGCGNWDFCRTALKKLKILPLLLQYMLSLLIFVVNNRDQFLINSEIHNINTRHSTNLHLPSANLGIYHKRVYYPGIKIFNSLPFSI